MTKTKASALLACMMAMAAPAHADINLRLSGQHTIDDPNTHALQQIAAEIEAADVGVSVQVFPANQLGDYTLIYEDIVRGSVDMAHLTVPSQLDSNLEANFFPFLVSDYEEMRRIYSPGSCYYGAYSEMQANLGVRLLGIVPEGFIGVALSKPAENLFEAGAEKGVLIRVPPIDTFNVGAAAMGFRGTTIAYADLYPALQSGLADGWVGGTAALNYYGFRDVVSEFIPYRAYVEATAYVISEQSWERLNEEQRDVISSAFANAAQAAMERAEENDRTYLARLEEAGITVHDFSGEVAEQFVTEVRARAWPELEERFGEDLVACLQSDVGIE